MSLWPHDDTASLIAFYGDPRSTDFADKKLVSVNVPWKMVLSWDTHHTVQHFVFHYLCAPALSRIFSRIKSVYPTQDDVENVGLHLWGGAYNYRPIRGSSRLSCHAFGAAIDFDPDHNGMNTVHRSHMAQPVIDAFKSEGAFWGGDFHTRQDPMHFQFARE